MKRSTILIIFIVLILAVSVCAFFWWSSNTKAVSSEESPTRFIIPKGRSAGQIAESLYERGLIRNPLAFKFYVQLTGSAGKIQAGEFRLSPDMNLSGLLDQLLKGPVEVWVTIPEGLRREEVVEKVITALEMGSEQAEPFRQEFLDYSSGVEGYLFPETYLFARDVKASLVVDKMRSTFNLKVTSEMVQKASWKGYSLDEIMILASILERETKTEEERALVAGIFFKRLETNWPLQVDATVQYAIFNAKCKMPNAKCGSWWPILTKDDLEIDSTYNSYKFAGLPPTPIASPGLSSIKAIIDPQESQYWYYIHDSEGGVHFAKTLEEHNRNIKNYLGK